MWILFGIFIGYLLFGESGIRGGGLIITNSKDEILLLQSAKSGKWGFPKGTYEPDDMAYYFTAIREMEEETTLQAQKDYTILPGGCRYGTMMYYYGTLNEEAEIAGIKINTRIQNEHQDVGWFCRTALPNSVNSDMMDWISIGMPSSCFIDQDL
jgi:8-oxo-dGTP pyrophosphatase MutT (NUDIX family)